MLASIFDLTEQEYLTLHSLANVSLRHKTMTANPFCQRLTSRGLLSHAECWFAVHGAHCHTITLAGRIFYHAATEALVTQHGELKSLVESQRFRFVPPCV